MKIKEGETIPNVKVIVLEKEHKERSSKEIFANGKIILFGLPGAFTPTCSNKHLPSFINSTEDLRKKNIKKVFCISVNDPYVMEAWGKSLNIKDQLTLISDIKSNFTKSIGAEFIWRGWARRSKRYTMLIENGTIKKIVEEE